MAIDLQLYALLTLLLWVGMRFGERAAVALVAATAMAALFHFNRNAELDAWAICFFASYGMGALVWWGCARGMRCAGCRCSPASPFSRWRSTSACALRSPFRGAAAAGVGNAAPATPDSGFCSAGLARAHVPLGLSGALFPVCLVANAFYARFTDGGSGAARGNDCRLGRNLLLGTAFHRYVEARRW